MAKTKLTGIERRLVLEYLTEGDVPLTIAHSGLFPIVVRAEQVKVLEKGIVLIQNANSLSPLIGKMVRVQFYFNKLALYFEASVQPSSAGIALVIPSVISKVEDAEPEASNSFSAMIYHESASKGGGDKCQKTSILCRTEENFPLFLQGEYKKVADRYLSSPHEAKIESIADRIHAPSVIYLDSERVLFASKKTDMPLSVDAEYAVCLRFPISGPIRERLVYISCLVDEMYENFDCDRLCACARISSIREEDERFLCDKIRLGQA